MTRPGVRVFYSQSPIKGVHGRFFAPFNGPNKNRCFYGDFGEIRHANRAMAIAKSCRYKICVVSCFENYEKFRFGFLALAFNRFRELRFAQYTVVKLQHLTFPTVYWANLESAMSLKNRAAREAGSVRYL